MAETMTPEEVRVARGALGLTGEQLGRMLRYKASHRQRVYELETGRKVLPAAKADLLRAYLEGYRPHDWPS